MTQMCKRASKPGGEGAFVWGALVLGAPVPGVSICPDTEILVASEGALHS